MIRWLKNLFGPSLADLEQDVREALKAMEPSHNEKLSIARREMGDVSRQHAQSEARARMARLTGRRVYAMPLDNKGLLISNTDLANMFFALSRVHERLGTLSHEQYMPLHGIVGDLKMIKDALDAGLKMEHDDVYGGWRQR